jgi:hypothetical protein
MRCSVYSSKPFSLVMIPVLLGMIALVVRYILPDSHVPLVFRILFLALVGLGLVAQVAGLISPRPVIQIDETGIRYYSRWFPLIDWRDVIRAERVPLVQHIGSKTHTFIREGWRPINVFVRGVEKYLTRIPTGMRKPLLVSNEFDCVRFELSFTGLSPLSEEVYDCIQHYLTKFPSSDAAASG